MQLAAQPASCAEPICLLLVHRTQMDMLIVLVVEAIILQLGCIGSIMYNAFKVELSKHGLGSRGCTWSRSGVAASM